MKDYGCKILGANYNLGDDGKKIPLDDWFERNQENLKFYRVRENTLVEDTHFRVIDGHFYPAWQYAHLFHKKIYVPNYLILDVCSLAEMFSEVENFKSFVTAWAKYLYVDRLPELSNEIVKEAKEWIKTGEVPTEFETIWDDVSSE